MKRFRFSLQRALDLRRQQGDLEAKRLEILAAEQERLEQQAVGLQHESRRTRAECGARRRIAAWEAQAVFEYARALGRARDETLVQADLVEQRRLRQMTAAIEARRKVRLLERLRARQRARYDRQADGDQERLATEVYLARRLNQGPPPAPCEKKKF